MEALAVWMSALHLYQHPETTRLSFLCSPHAADIQLPILGERIPSPLHLLTFKDLFLVYKVDLLPTIAVKSVRVCGTNEETTSRVTCM
jgi:hypothetical protein